MTYHEFLTVLRRSTGGWKVYPPGTMGSPGPILRSENVDCCPWLWVRAYGDESPLVIEGADKRVIWAAADGAAGHDPVVRRDLLQACGLLSQ